MAKELKDWIDEFVENGANPKDVTNWPEEAGGGSTVVANPTLVGDEPDLTGLQVDGAKYKVPQGGGAGSTAITFTPIMGLLDVEAVYNSLPWDENYTNSITIDINGVMDYLSTKIDINTTVDYTEDLEIIGCPFIGMYDLGDKEPSISGTLCNVREYHITGTSGTKRVMGCNPGYRVSVRSHSGLEITKDYTLEDIPQLLRNAYPEYDVYGYAPTTFTMGIGNVIYLTYTNATTHQIEKHTIIIDDMKAFANKCFKVAITS